MFSAGVERASRWAVHILSILHGHSGGHTGPHQVNTQLVLEADLQRKGLGIQPLFTSRCPRQLYQVIKNASMAPTALSGYFSDQERQVQPQKTIQDPQTQSLQGR